MPKKSNLKRASFTLIEMLVVIAIIMILASLLLPAVHAAREKGRYARWLAFMNQNRGDSALLIQYIFEDGSGSTTVTNQGGGTDILNHNISDYDGILTGTAVVTKTDGRWPGKGGVYFRGGGTDYLTASNAKYKKNFMQGKMAATAMAWIYVNSADAGTAGVLFYWGNNDPIRSSGHVPWGGTIYWDHGICCGAGRIATSMNGYYDQWVHLALVSEGIGGSYKAIYVNGVKIAEDTGPSDGPPVNLFGFRIGAFSDGNNRQVCKMDSFCYYARRLSDREILQHYSMGAP